MILRYSQRDELLQALKNLLDFPKEDLEQWASDDKNIIPVTFVGWHIRQALEAIQKADGL